MHAHKHANWKYTPPSKPTVVLQRHVSLNIFSVLYCDVVRIDHVSVILNKQNLAISWIVS